MRYLALSGTAALALMIGAAFHGPAQAQYSGTWCLLDLDWTPMDCSFISFQQCRLTASGTGRTCQRSPFVQQPPVRGRRHRARH